MIEARTKSTVSSSRTRLAFVALAGVFAFGCEERDETDAIASAAPPRSPPAMTSARPRPVLQPAKPLAPELTYRVPEGWRELDGAATGPVVADFVAREGGPTDRVRVLIQRRAGAKAATPDKRVAAEEAALRSSFTEITNESRKEHEVNAVRVVVLELEGVQRRQVPASPGSSNVSVSERPQTNLVAIVETPGVPYRVFASGSAEAIAEVRESFMRLVESLRLVPE